MFPKLFEISENQWNNFSIYDAQQQPHEEVMFYVADFACSQCLSPYLYGKGRQGH